MSSTQERQLAPWLLKRRIVDGELHGRADRRPTDEEVCDAVATYLAENPRAMDTLEGIATWWVPRQQIRLDVERVWRALELLKKRGIVEEVIAADRQWYRLKMPMEQVHDDSPEH